MVLPWRRHERKRRQGKKLEISGGEIKIPADFRCPISLDLMKDPVTLSTGITYDRNSIESWFESGKDSCPVTNRTLDHTNRTVLIPNHTMRKMIQEWCVDHRSYGIERIPTPRVPLTPREVSEICKKLMEAVVRQDNAKCLEIVGKIKNLGRESERNKKCLAQNGVVSVLSSCFERFSSAARERHMALLEEVISVLAWPLLVRSEGLSKIMGTASSLRCIVHFLNSSDPSARQNAAFLLREVVSSDTSYARTLTDIEGASEGLVNLIQNPTSPNSTKSSLMVIYHMATTNDQTVSRFVQMGLVSSITEMVLNTEKGISERALVVLDAICNDEQGREAILRNDLIVPLLVKKILRVSDLATMCSISILWKLGKKEESVLVEALQVGAFEKLLVVLQVGCEGETREKVSELLKRLNLLRNEVGMKCVDSDSSMRLKYVKRSF
ncbi:PREDICTED: U-box domain-containing protein 21 [Tarenaya hassleriana]|uniref:U-box domain-containing protein 21 n=1 Tax=Tarenaya hassleriana TaxID=28532 RepID=UPI00053C686F|nr:PREDICTED: U-box domain-containing protein 21 [Tarenaya hassleriana]